MPDPVRVGRLRPVGFAKRGALPATTPVPAGSFITPTLFPRYVPPWNWNPEQPLLESPAHQAQREIPNKAVKGPASVTGKKLNVELEPDDVLGNLLAASFGQDTVTGDGAASTRAHNFESLNADRLPVYDWWDDGGAGPGGRQNGFAAMMVGKMDLFIAKAEIKRLETEWTGLNHVDGLALAPALVFFPRRPLQFAQTAVLIDDVQQKDNQILQITMDNKVVADHVNDDATNFAQHIWSEGQEVMVNYESLLTDVAQYNKWLNSADPATPAPVKMEAVITSQEQFTDGPTEPFVFRFQLPAVNYRTGEIQYPTGVVRAVLTGVGLNIDGTIGSGGNAHAYVARSLVAQFVNGVATPY